MQVFLVMDMWNTVVTRTNDHAEASRAARACGGYVIVR